MADLKSIAVYCGSSVGHDPVFVDAAVALADYFVRHDIQMVNGGGSIGLMGVMADRMMQQDGRAVGVIPLALKDKEVAHLGMTELIVVPDMHSRKLTIVNLSDAFIALPGGFGTLDELFETLTWSQLHLHHKPIGILNVNGYYDGLLSLADDMVVRGFVRPAARTLLRSARDIETLMGLLQQPTGRFTTYK